MQRPLQPSAPDERYHQVTTNSRFVGKNILISATAVVKIIDNAGQPVSGATVSGHWSGATVDTNVSHSIAWDKIVKYGTETYPQI